MPVPQTSAIVSLSKVPFLAPDRTGLPELSRYAHLRMGGDVEKYIEMFDDVYKQIETDVEESCGLTVPEGISKNVATFEDGVRRLLGVETPEMEEKPGFPINIGRVGNKKPHRK